MDKEGKLFFEFTRNTIPIGLLGNFGFIYLLNIKSRQSKIGIMLENRESFIIVSDKLSSFFLEKHSVSEIKQSLLSVGPIVSHQYGIKDSKIYMVYMNTLNNDQPVTLWPFGDHTRDIFTNKNAIYKAESISEAEALKMYKRKNKKIYITYPLGICLIAYMLKIFSWSTSAIVSSIIVCVILSPALLILISRIKGGSQRV